MHFPSGQQAYEVEAATLRWLRLELGLPPALTARDMPQMGFTETVYASDISLEDLWLGVREVVAQSGRALEGADTPGSGNDPETPPAT